MGTTEEVLAWERAFKPARFAETDHNALTMLNWIQANGKDVTVATINEALRACWNDLQWLEKEKPKSKGSFVDKLTQAGEIANTGRRNHAAKEEVSANRIPSLHAGALQTANKLHRIGAARQALQQAQSIVVYNEAGNRISHSGTAQARKSALEQYKKDFPDFPI